MFGTHVFSLLLRRAYVGSAYVRVHGGLFSRMGVVALRKTMRRPNRSVDDVVACCPQTRATAAVYVRARSVNSTGSTV